MNASSPQVLCPSLTISHNKNVHNFDYSTNILVCIINGLLITPTVLLNLLIILGVLRNPALRKPSYLLICALAFTDFGVGVILQPVFIARKIAILSSHQEVYCSLLKSGNILAHLICSPSFFIVTVISIDRYLAIRLRNRYSQVVTIKTVGKFIVACMLSAFIVTAGRLQATKPNYMGVAAVLMFLLLLVIVFCYLISLKTLKKHQMQVQNIQQPMLIQTVRHKRTLCTLLIVVSVLFLCYIPFVGVVIAIAIHGRTKQLTIAWEVTATLLFLNSCFNPLLHLWRCKELRQSCVNIFRSSNRHN